MKFSYKINWFTTEYFLGLSFVLVTRGGISSTITLDKNGEPKIVDKRDFGKYLELRIALVWFMVSLRVELKEKNNEIYK